MPLCWIEQGPCYLQDGENKQNGSFCEEFKSRSSWICTVSYWKLERTSTH
ncbi:hypothetical protein Hdeb2414_s0001g00006741 [Helianthus debilis subsp. tardiflorus]